MDQRTWWLVYTRSRQEKQLMRHLRVAGLPHYAPQIANRRRSPAGRIRITYQPLFSNYVFLCGEEEARYKAVCTGCVQSVAPIEDVAHFVSDLRQIQALIDMNVPLTIEDRIQPGQQVRVKSGVFAGYEGTVLQRTQETRLLVAVRFMERGVSVKLDDCQLEVLSKKTAEASE
ncbi:transcriptional activator RfaH [Rubripirellula tenax]|uniref:Transcriptional activator RfaH n=1 Tax=Rubripirellula tenax TaxID=2528015 RepID=A0A5C6EIS0_9BACT|nr:transcriptional activator RfaH [Rubripirellula tenax]